MCPPVQSPLTIDFCWSDEQICSLLADYKPGSPLPADVLADSIPYQYPPSNLPEGIWYLVHSNEKKESGYGFWKARGEARNVFSNATINGWRTTLEYFEGPAHNGQITDWLMQEYRITEKESSDKDKPKESRLLCRVFLCSGHRSKSEMSPQKCKTNIEPENINPVKSINPNTNITSDQDSRSESKAKREHELGPFPVVADTRPNYSPQNLHELECFSSGDFLELNDLEAGTRPNYSPQNLSELEHFSTGDFLELNDLEDPESPHSSSSQNSSCPSKCELECFSRGDFLEFNDLEDPESHSSSSQNSSCPSKLSDEYFDSSAFLRKLEEEKSSDIQEQVLSSNYSFSTSVVPNGVVLQPALSGSVVTGSLMADVTDALKTSSTADSKTKSPSPEQTTKRHNPESKTESPSNFSSAETPSTSHKNTVPSGEKKACAGRLKKFKTYFCFAAF